MESKSRWYHKFIFIISIIVFVFFAYEMIVYKILPIKYRLIFIIGVILLYSTFVITSISCKNSLLCKNIISSIFILMALAFAMMHLYLTKSVDVLDSEEKKPRPMQMDFSIIVRNDSPYQTIEDIVKSDVYTAFEMDSMNVQLFQEQLKKDKNLKLNYENGKNYIEIAQNLLDEKIEVMLLNETFRDTMDEHIKEFSDKTRIIYSVKVQQEVREKIEAKAVGSDESFNVYISGADTYDNLYTVSRSDVNLIVTVNPKSHKVLITTIPRDSYLKIAGEGNNEYDKFTHAGIYGISSSIETLENELDLIINYYIKVNFNSMIDIVDAIGGIEVENVEPIKTVKGGYYFPKGKIQLDGKRALSFARERKSYSDGDFERGRNHTRILEAMIHKAMSPSILLNYSYLLDVVNRSMETNIPSNVVIDLINRQIENNAEWNIEKLDIKGEGSTELNSYAMPGYKLWMFVPYKESMKEVIDKIDEVEESHKVD